MSFPTDDRLQQVYGEDASRAAERLKVLEGRYRACFGDAALSFFTSPGRTEIIGNHTDHNGGKILAASITMDTIAAAASTEDGVITIVSEGYPDPVVVKVDEAAAQPKCAGTPSLVAGMVVAARERGYRVGGFNACVSSEVVPAAGVSSSASFEMLVAEIISCLFNDDAISLADRARMGQYAENVFWEKASGLMDQMACAHGGTIALDFSSGVDVRGVDFGFEELGYRLIIVNTGKGHADLSEEYSAVPGEMHAVARALGVEELCETSEEALLQALPRVREEVASDRAVLRALHYFEECRRVEEAIRAIEAGDPSRVLSYITVSGNSSWKWLQNAYVSSDTAEQPVSLALALTEIFLAREGRGVCRLHGGGFAGVIMCVVPADLAQAYVDYMTPFVGADHIYQTNIRQTGAALLA